MESSEKCEPMLQPGEASGTDTAESIIDKTSTVRSKYIRTGFVCTSCILVGIYTNILGPSLLEVEYFTGSTTKSVSSLFIWRHGGYLMGSLVVGPLVDRFNEYFLIAVSFSVMTAAVAVSPWWRELLVFGVLFAVGGVANCFCVVSAVTAIISIWGAKADPFQQAAFFSLNIGTALSPQVFKPFLDHTTKKPINHTKADNGGNNTEDVMEVQNSSYIDPFTGYIDPFIGDNSNLTFQYGYMIVAACLICGFILNSIIVCNNGFRIWKSQKNSGPAAAKTARTYIEGVPKIVVLVLQFVLGFLQSAIEECFTGLLITFLVKHLGWADRLATDMIIVYSISSAISRGLGIIVSKFVRASRIMAVLILCTLCGYLLLVFAFYSHWIIPWISSVLIGLGFGAFYAALINWENSCVELRGKETSIIFISVSIGKMTSPFFVGYLFEEHSPTWFIYMGLIYSVILLCMYIVKYITVGYFLRNVHQNHNTDEKEEMNIHGEKEI